MAEWPSCALAGCSGGMLWRGALAGCSGGEASKKPEARKRPARGQREASKRPGRGQQEARKRSARGQQEARKRLARGQDKKLARAKSTWGTSGCGLGFRVLSIHVYSEMHTLNLLWRVERRASSEALTRPLRRLLDGMRQLADRSADATCSDRQRTWLSV